VSELRNGVVPDEGEVLDERLVRESERAFQGSSNMKEIREIVDLTNRRSGRLMAQWPVGKKQGKVYWLCVCDCGGLKFIPSNSVLHQRARSCGCSRRTHGYRTGKGASIYRCWLDLWARCTNPKCRAWKNYGGRGIRVCERWRKFENFLKDMGIKPSLKHSIDRYPNNDGNYEPGNCRWATAKEQIANRRKKVPVPTA
jgi:hypothetical protein